MTAKEFVFWLRGVNVGVSGHPYEKTWGLIIKKLSEVDTKDIECEGSYLPNHHQPLAPNNVPTSPGSPPEIIC